MDSAIKSSTCFSVAICTFRRPRLLARAVESVFSQAYPTDCYEMIVVDNDSGDETGKVLEDCRGRSPVSFTSHVESVNGISYARNAAIRLASKEFVAFLDDDEEADPGWLAALDKVIREQHALVVGGRMDYVLPPEVAVTPWLKDPGVLAHFGVNFGVQGKHNPVFQIRHPQYIGVGNSAYARRLFDAFGPFPTHLGRNQHRMLGAEETYFNILLERHDIPIFYSDQAVAKHHVDRSRLSRRHLLEKAFWCGWSNAVVYEDFFTAEQRRAMINSSAIEALAKLKEGLFPRSGSRLFPAWMRMSYDAGFLPRLCAGVFFPDRVRRPAPEVSWGIADFIREVAAWPDSVEKSVNLRFLYREAGDAHAEPSDLLASADRLWGPVQRLAYRRFVAQLKETVAREIPKGSRVLVLSKGDDALVSFEDNVGLHFPQGPLRCYAGHYPPDDGVAVTHLKQIQAKGADYLLVPSHSFWWFTHYPGFRHYLRDGFHVVFEDEACVIFDLSARTPKTAGHPS